jgi:hypothetical protein
MDAPPPPLRSSTRPRILQKSWQHFEYSRSIAGEGRYDEGAHHKAGGGGVTPRAQRFVIRMRIIMAAVNCSVAVMSRRAKYYGDFRVPTHLEARPLGYVARATPARNQKY